MAIITVELASILSTIFVIVKLKLNKKFITWILKGVTIYLPPIDKDYELICELKKDKTQNRKANAIVRVCQVEEYIELAKDENYDEIDLISIFYLSSIFNLIFIIFLKIFNSSHNFYFRDYVTKVICQIRKGVTQLSIRVTSFSHYSVLLKKRSHGLQ